MGQRYWQFALCLLASCIGDCPGPEHWYRDRSSYVVNDTGHTVEIEVGLLWIADDGAREGEAGSALCDSRLAHDELLKPSDFSDRHKHELPPGGLLRVGCSPTLLRANDVAGAFYLPEQRRREPLDPEDDPATNARKIQADPTGLIFFRCADGDSGCRFEVGEGPQELELLLENEQPATSTCYDAQPRAYAELVPTTHGRLLGTRLDDDGCFWLDMESAPVSAQPSPDAGEPDMDMDASLGPEPPWDDAGAAGDDAGSASLPSNLDAAAEPAPRRNWAIPDPEDFVPEPYTHRVCMERAQFPFAVGELLGAGPTDLRSESASLTFSLWTGQWFSGGTGAPPATPVCSPVRMACGAVVQPLEVQLQFGSTAGQTHEVLLPGTTCGPSMDRRQTWIEWLELGPHGR